MRDYLAMLGKEILLGKRGENNHLRVVFDISNWRKTYGDGVVALLHQRSGDKTPYPCPVEQDGDRACWAVTAADVEMAGRGKAELQYIVGDTCVKSDTYTTFAEQGVDKVGAEPGRPEASWVSKVLRAERNAENAKRDIENMTVTGDMVPHDSTEPTVEKSKNPDGTVNLHFHVRQGAKAAYVGSDKCPPGYNIQIDPEGEANTDDIVEEVLDKMQPLLEDANNVFIATYGETTFEELRVAYDAGKTIIVRDGNKDIPLLQTTGSQFVFSTSTRAINFQRRCTVNGGWETYNYNIPSAEDLEALETQMGDMETALDAILTIQNALIGGDAV